MFQYNILNSILYLNEQLYVFNKKDTELFSYCRLQDETTELCSYCRLQDETTNHIFVECKLAIKS